MAHNKGENGRNSVEGRMYPLRRSDELSSLRGGCLWMILATLGETVRDRLSALSPSSTKELIITFQTLTALVDKCSFVQSFNRRSQINVADQVNHPRVFYFLFCPDHSGSETQFLFEIVSC